MPSARPAIKAKPAATEAAAGVDPVTFALAGVLAIASLAAWRVLSAARTVIAAAEEKETYSVLFITDDGMKSDSAQLEADLNAGLAALRSAQSEATLLLVVCGILAAALAWRLIKANGRSL